MNYVQGIIVNGKPVPTFRDFGEDGLVLDVHGVGLVSGSELKKLEALGFVHKESCNQYSAVLHNERSVCLYEHITYADHGPMSMLVNYHEADYIELDRYRKVNGNPNIVIDTRHDFYKFGDKYGSVCFKYPADGFSAELYTLYDFLLMASREAGVRLMDYERIQFINRDSEVCSQVGLQHGCEAEKFFAEMKL